MTRSHRKTVVSIVAGLLLAAMAVPAAAAPPAAPEVELYAPEGNHGDPSRRVATNQPVTVEGNIDPASTSYRVHLDQQDAGGTVVKTNDITALVDPDQNGDFATGELTVSKHAQAKTLHVRATASNADGTSQSQPDQLSFLTLDRTAPRISAYAVTSTTTIRVTFSENVWHPNPSGDDPRDWTVTSDSGSQTPTRVEQGTGRNVRTLHLGQPLDPNATPTVDYSPYAPDLLQAPYGPYEDEVQQELDLAGREQQASDEVPPDAPSIDQIAGESTPARGNDTTPTIRVTGLQEGNTAEVFRASNDTSQGSATAGSDGTAIITVPQPLGDGDPPETYSFYARATDTNGNASDPGPQASYTLDTVAPTPTDAVVDPDENGADEIIAVFFSEAISGTNGAGQWSLSNCTTTCPNVIAVTGSDGSNQRRLEADGTVPEGAELTWTPPGSGAYQDEAGNPMASFSGLDVQAELPAMLQAVAPAGPVTEGAPGGTTNATFTVRLSKTDTSLVIANWSTQDGTAKSGQDYEASSGTLTFLPGQTEKQVQVPVQGDATDEPDEAFSIVLTQSFGAPIDQDQSSASATVVDDDPAPAVSLGADTGLPEGDGTNQFTLDLSLAVASGKQVTVAWSTSPGTATPGSDYRSATGSITFEPGATSASIPLEILGDTLGEHDETFRVTLTSATNATIERATSTVTIVNDDPASLRVRDTSVVEPTSGSTPVSVQVTATPAVRESTTVSWQTADGTAVAGEDYEASSGTVTFEPGQASATVTVPVLADGESEPSETFAVRLTSVDGEAAIVDPEATVTIGLTSASAACPAGQVSGLEFDDVSGVHAGNIACASWYTIALGKGDVDGDGRPEYVPGGFVTRAQMASFIARLAREAGVELSASPPNAFEDDDSSIHRTSIDQLAAAGIVQGRADTGDSDGDGDTSEVLYFPAERVSRAQMATFIARVHEQAAGALAAGPNTFEDDDGSVHRDNVDRIAAAGIVQGRRDSTDADGDGDRDEILYFPADPVTRGQMATFLMQDLGELVNDGVAHVGGATVELTSSSTSAGGQVQGTVTTNKQVRSLVADGCGVDSRTVSVASDGSFSVSIPSSQPAGTCTLALTATTRRAGATADQTVTHEEPVSVS